METHRAALPYDVDLAGVAHDQPYVATATGDYVFIGYEQRTFEPTGWSAWKNLKSGEASTSTWRDSSPSARAAADRVRAGVE